MQRQYLIGLFLFPIIISIITIFFTNESHAKSINISGSYVASTKFGNIFCMDITQQNEKIKGNFEEVDFQQIVPIEKGIFKDNILSFSVLFMVNKRPVLLEMSAEMIKKNPVIFFGNYNIGKEKADFILYSVKVKPPICRMLHRKK